MPSVERRLATIRAADVVGYGRMPAVDEEGTLRTLNAGRESTDGLIRHGRVFRRAGDSVMVVSASSRRDGRRISTSSSIRRSSCWRRSWRWSGSARFQFLSRRSQRDAALGSDDAEAGMRRAGD